MTTTKITPIAITTQTHSGVAGAFGAASGAAGAASVWKLKVADQSLGAGSRDITRQK